LSEDDVENDMVVLGLAGMMDPPRPEAIDAIRVCKQVHIKPVMITGDHKLTAVAIARRWDSPGGRAGPHGEELGKLSDEAFAAIVQTVTVYARVSPWTSSRS